MMTLDEKIAALMAKHGIKNPKTNSKAKPSAKPKSKKTRPRTVATRPNKAAEKAEMFARAYIRHGCNATAAYKELSPDCKDTTAKVEGSKYLTKPNVQRILSPLLEKLMEKNEVDTEFVIGRLLEQANGSALDYFHIEEDGRLGPLDLASITEAQRRNLKSIKITDTKYGQSISIIVSDQQRAVEMFAKYLQMFAQEAEPEDVKRIGDLITAGVERIRKNKDLTAWKTGAYEGTFSSAG